METAHAQALDLYHAKRYQEAQLARHRSFDEERQPFPEPED